MLAKVAHAFAFATWGVEAFRPLLPALILGETNDWPPLVGGYMELPPPSDPTLLHTLSIGRRKSHGGLTYVVVHVRLFSNTGAPQYRVVVGEAKSGRD
jgi:hypothetical protein